MKKLANAVHYIIATADTKKLGKTKLNKILWFADRVFMLKYLDTITHSEYIKMPCGPVPKYIDKVIKILKKEGKILEKRDNFGKYEFISLKDPDIKDFKPEEISVLDSLIYTINNDYKAKEISEISHGKDWESVEKIGDVIPVESILGELATDDITLEELQEAKAIFENHKC